MQRPANSLNTFLNSQAITDDANEAVYCVNNRTRNLKTEPDYNNSNNSSDIDPADWDAIKETDDSIDDLDQEEADNLSDGAQDRIMDALDNLSRDLFQNPKSKKSSMNSLSRASTMNRSSGSFQTFYVKSCKEFLQSKDDKLSKQRKQKEEEENKLITHRPSLVSKQQKKQHIPLVEKAKAMEVRRTQAFEKAKKEKAELQLKELEGLTFRPNINGISKALMTCTNKEETIERLYQGKGPSKQEKTDNQNESDKLFKPQINRKSNNLARNVINKTSSKVEDRLLLQATMTQAKKAKLVDDSISSFTPRLNKTTQKIVEQIRNRDFGFEPRTVEEQFQSVRSQASLKVPSKGSCEINGEVKSIEIPHTERRSPKRARMEESPDARKYSQNIQFDDQLMDNLKQLTMLLQIDDRPNTTRHDRRY